MLSVTLFLISLIGSYFAANTEERLGVLELRLEKELNKTETDIIGLKQMIERLNATECHTCKDTKLEDGNETKLDIATNVSSADTNKGNEGMDQKIKHVFDHVEKNSQALMDEFEKTLIVLRNQHQHINRKINTNKITIGRVKETLSVNGKNNGDISEKMKRNDFRIGKFENKLSVLDDNVNDIKKELLKHNLDFLQFDRQLTLLLKKDYDIGENIERNFLTVANIDHRMVEMDRRYNDFVNDWNKFKADMELKIEELNDKLKLTPSGHKGTPKTCPISWIKNGNTCYLYDKATGEDWPSAVSMCSSLGAKLAEPDTREEMEFLRGFIHGWIGASDIEKEGVFVWESSKNQVEYMPWWPGMPDNYDGDQDCVSLWGSVVNDEDCSKRYRYVCEKRLE